MTGRRVYRIRTGKTLFGFGDPIADVPILGRTLADWQERIASRFKLRLADVGDEAEIEERPYLAFRDDLFFTPAFFKAALDEANRSTHSLRFCLAHNCFNDRFVLPSSHQAQSEIALPFVCTHDERAGQETACVIRQRVYPHGTAIPGQVVSSGFYDYPQCSVFASSIHSPFHLLQLNLAMGLYRSAIIRDRFPKSMVDRIAPFSSRRFFWLLRAINKIGRGCRIHPTARLEGVHLADNVVVGANAIVRLSTIGSGTTIDDQASVTYSVVGERNYIFNKNHLSFSMTYDDVFLIHGPYNFSVFGRSSAVFAVINCDFRLDQENIKIPTDFGIVDSRQPLLGIAYGHGSKIGGGNIIAPGRIVPNYQHIEPPANIIMGFPDHARV